MQPRGRQALARLWPALQARPLTQPQRRVPLRVPLQPACRYSWEPWHNARLPARRQLRRGCPARAAHRHWPVAHSPRQSCVHCARPSGGSLPASIPRCCQPAVLIVSKFLHSFPRGQSFPCANPSPLLRSAQPGQGRHVHCSQKKGGSAEDCSRCPEVRIREL